VDREPDLDRAARLAHCSPFHFLRMFEVVSGLTPGEYSRRRRLSRAAVDLASSDDRVIDIALRYGYETPEAFAKAFKRLFGLTPTEARQPAVPLQTWPALRLAVVLQGDRSLDYRIVRHPAFEAVGWAHRTSALDGSNFRTIPAFWNECLAADRVEPLVRQGGPLGSLGVCGEWDLADQTFTYLIAVERQPGQVYPEGTRRLSVPAATYVVFPCVGAMPTAMHETWKRAYAEWFPGSGYEFNGGPDFEVYPRFDPDDPRGDPDSPECYSEVWIPIRKSLTL